MRESFANPSKKRLSLPLITQDLISSLNLPPPIFYRMTAPAAKVLQDFYLDLRERHKSLDSTPITTRQLESMIRLSEARAKAELRETVTEQDALDVVELTRESLFQTFEDELGNIDFRRGGSGMSNAKGVRALASILKKEARRTGNSTFTFEEMRSVAQGSGLHLDGFSEMVESLNHQNFLIKRGPRVYNLNID